MIRRLPWTAPLIQKLRYWELSTIPLLSCLLPSCLLHTWMWLDNQPPSPAEDLRQYSQMIQRIVKVMDLQVLQPDIDETCKFFGHLNKNQALPLCMGFIPSLLNHAKAVWNKPYSTPLMPRRIDNLYRTNASTH
ncbi:hypothetical protein JRQ81_003075 [Phrynocephalus forsythii]|uniref:Uncharacterized protein n=1 Tax=Phrynocephalus forsythii TaxID=171643 RepID=A0A9Q0XLB8_9SAUR|nr:hypothetical protein JRQ81_003075 [Phrynocephalus forsythii]